MTLSLTRSPAPSAPIDALIARLESRGGGRRGMRGLLASPSGLERHGRRTWAPGLAVRRCWTWERIDRLDPTWFPQGVAHSSMTGYADDVLLVSWYSKAGQGSRVSVFDLRTGRYQHVGLVEVMDGGGLGDSPNVRPIEVHAGGLVWHGSRLYVAATRRGFLSFDVDDLVHDPSAAYGFEYLLPLRAAHRAEEDGLRFSFMSLDRSAKRPAILVGEYVRGTRVARLAHYALDDAGELAVDDTGASPAHVVGEGVAQMQGAVAVRGLYYLTVSHGSRAPGEVVIGYPGPWRRRRFRTPPGPEDLAFDPGSDRFWSITEHPGRRWVFSMPRRALRP